MLLTDIEKIIETVVSEYNAKLSEKYNLKSDELQELWKQISGSDVKVAKVTKKTTTDDKSETASVKSGRSKKSTEGGCPYVFIKGKDEGNSCGSKPKDGLTYCGKHQKCEGVGQAEKKKSPVGKKSIANSPDNKDKKPKEEKKVQIVIRLNKKLDKYWNPETFLVFKSKEDRVVVGSYKEEKYEKLTPDDIVICEKYGFKYEKDEEPSTLSQEIIKTNLQAEHIENVLSEICKDDEEEIEEEDE